MLCAVCCVLCAVCCVLCAVCCVLCAVCCVWWESACNLNNRFAHDKNSPAQTHKLDGPCHRWQCVDRLGCICMKRLHPKLQKQRQQGMDQQGGVERLSVSMPVCLCACACVCDDKPCDLPTASREPTSWMSLQVPFVQNSRMGRGEGR